MNNIKALISTFIKRNSNWKTNLLQQWPDIMGPLSEQVRIEKITNQCVVLGVYDSCWMQEMYLLSAVIIKKINETIDRADIKEVRFKLVTRKTNTEQKALVEKKRVKKITFSRSEQLALSRIKDETLRAGLEAFLIRCYRERE